MGLYIKSPHLANTYPTNLLGEKMVVSTSMRISYLKSRDLCSFNSHDGNLVRGISISPPGQGMADEKSYMAFVNQKEAKATEPEYEQTYDTLRLPMGGTMAIGMTPLLPYSRGSSAKPESTGVSASCMP